VGQRAGSAYLGTYGRGKLCLASEEKEEKPPSDIAWIKDRYGMDKGSIWDGYGMDIGTLYAPPAVTIG